MRIVISAFIICILCMCLCSCSQVVSTEVEEIEVMITEVHYGDVWTKLVEVIRFGSYGPSAEYTPSYKGISITVYSQEQYEYYQGKLGTIITCELTTEYYTNGTTQQILKIKEK